MYDGRPNCELFLATGTVEDQNPADSLLMTVELVKADRMYTAKKSILESLGLSISEVSHASHPVSSFSSNVKKKHPGDGTESRISHF